MRYSNKLHEKLYDKSPDLLQNLMCSFMGYQQIKNRYGSLFEEHMRHLKKQEFYTEEALVCQQEKELKKLLRHCSKEVPYYQRLFKKLGIEAQDISLHNLSELPILEKKEVKAAWEDFVPISCDRSRLMGRYTSGTTGSGMFFYVDKRALQLEYAFVWARSRPMGNRKEPFVSFGGRRIVPLEKQKPPFYRRNIPGKQLLFSQYHLNPKHFMQYVDALNNLHYTYMQGYPSAMYTLASFLRRQGLKLKQNPKVIYTSSETLYDYQRLCLEEVFQCPVYDYYGSSELSSSLYQCQHKTYHLNYEYGVTELCPLPESFGENVYEIIGTGFINRVFPLLRYRLSDFVKVVGGNERCACGRPGPMISSILGRMEDIIVTPEGNRIGLLAPIFKPMLHILESQIIQESPNALTVLVVKDPAYGSADEALLRKGFANYVSPRMKVDIRYVAAIPRGKSGKLRSVISKLSEPLN